jgi:hypothetical protein
MPSNRKKENLKEGIIVENTKKPNKVGKFFSKNEELICNTIMFTTAGAVVIYLTYVLGHSKGARDLGAFAGLDQSTMLKFAFRHC